MSYIESFSIIPDRKHPWPYDIPAVRYAEHISLDPNITFIIGENGSGKSTLLETLGYRLQLPCIDGLMGGKSGFEAAKKLQPFLEINYKIERSAGFFFRAEDFTDYIGSVDRANQQLDKDFSDLREQVSDSVIEQMKYNNNFALNDMRKIYGQNLETFSHGEAYLKIMEDRVYRGAIYLLDEPEAALSPSRQLSLIHFIAAHLQKHMSQFVIATHSPMLMAYPGAKILEITDDGISETPLEETAHYSITKSFLNNPEAYLRHLDI